MGIYDWARNLVQNLVWGGIEAEDREKFISKRRAYRTGIQARQLKIKSDNADDNIIINFTGLVVDRAVTMLFGNGVEFDMPGEDEDPQSQYIDMTWDANKEQILLHKLGVLGAESGTCFVKMIPDGVRGKDGKMYVRLVAIDPKIISTHTNPDDIEDVTGYTIEYSIKRDGKEIDIKQETTKENDSWVVVDYERMRGKKAWEEVNRVAWEYSFPPIHHWQNLPNPLSVYGMPDITDDVIALQDRINFTAGNISKIIRYHAHPQTIVVGVAEGDIKTAPGQALFLPEGGNAFNLEMTSDLVSSSNYLQYLQNSLFSITQTVDISSFTDKLGALTNFGLKVLYQDALARLHTKQELYGDALVELNRRMSVIGGFEDDGGEIIWPEILPVNDIDVITALKSQMELGVISKQSVARELGIDWTEEEERLASEKTANLSVDNNIGNYVLQNFMKGK